MCVNQPYSRLLSLINSLDLGFSKALRQMDFSASPSFLACEIGSQIERAGIQIDLRVITGVEMPQILRRFSSLWCTSQQQ